MLLNRSFCLDHVTQPRTLPGPIVPALISSRRARAVRAAESEQFSLHPSEITILIKQCGTHQQLNEVVQRHGPGFNYIHAAAAFTHAAQLAQQLLQQQHPRRASRNPASLQSQQIAQLQQTDTSPAAAVTDHLQQWVPELCSTLLPLLQHAEQQCSNFQGRQVANCLWAAQRLLHVLLWAQRQHSDSAVNSPDGLQDSSTSSSAALATSLQHPQQQQLLEQLQLFVQQLVRQAESCWHLFSGQELVLLLYSVTNILPATAAAAASLPKVSHSSSSSSNADTSCTDNVGVESQHSSSRSRSTSSSSVGNSINTSSLPLDPKPTTPAAVPAAEAGVGAASAVASTAWLNTAVGQLQRQQYKRRLRLRPQEYEMLLISCRRLLLAQQQQQPHAQAADALYNSLQQQKQQQSWDSEEEPTEQQQQQQQRGMQSTPSSNGSFHVPMTLLQQQLAAVLQHQQQRCSCRDVTGIVYSYAVLCRLQPSGSGSGSSSSSLRKLAASLTPKALSSSCNAVDITNLLYGLGLITPGSSSTGSSSSSNVSPTGQTVHWWKGLLKGLARQLPLFTAAEIVACFHALAKMRIRLPERLAAAMLNVAAAQLQPQQQQELAMLLWSVGTWRFKPDQRVITVILTRYLQGAVAAADAGLQQQQQLQLAAQHVSMVLWACGRLGFCPPAGLLNALLYHSWQLLPYAAPEHLACIAYGLGCITVRPNALWLSRFYQRVAAVGFSEARESAGGLTEQGLGMVFWGLSRMRVPVESAHTARAAADATAAESDVRFYNIITSLTDKGFDKSPAAVGVVLWSLIKLGYSPEPQLIQSLLHSLARPQLQQALKQKQQQQQQPGRRRHWQQHDARRGLQLMQSLSLAAWSVGKLKAEATDAQKQLLQQALKVHTQLLHHASPKDLICLLWSLQQLQLQPSSQWLLNFYSASQDKMEQFSELQLASLTALLDKLLLQQQQQPQQQQNMPMVPPPAVWQLQLELELRNRRRNETRRRRQRTQERKQDVEGISEVHEQRQQGQQDYDPLLVVAGVLRKWRLASVDSWRQAFDRAAEQGVAEQPLAVV